MGELDSLGGKRLGMRTRITYILVVSVFCSLAFGCASLPKSSKQDVIRQANAAVQKAGFHLEDFQPPKVHYATGLHEWMVMYDTKALLVISVGRLVPPTKPDQPYEFLIFVDDRTGEVDMENNQPSDIPLVQR